MTTAFLNRIATAVPDHDVHAAFIAFAPTLLESGRERALFQRMAERSAIEHRYSTLAPAPVGSNVGPEKTGFYMPGAFPSTAARMRVFAEQAPRLAVRALDRLARDGVPDITHVIAVTCTGFTAPGLDLAIVRHLGLPDSVERTQVGFMGCAASLNALKLARHIVRSEPDATVLVVSLELCTLHLQDVHNLEQLLSFLIFADGCAAALVSRTEVGLSLESFTTRVAPDTAPLINWTIGDQGFDMVLSGRVPAAIRSALPHGVPAGEIAHWAVHPGGRSVLDAVEQALALPATALGASRAVLREFGNMSSATILFVLDRIMAGRHAPGESGCALAFGPGLAAEAMTFRVAA